MVDNDAEYGLPISYVQYKSGLLGDCFTAANQTQKCSRSSLKPKFDPQALTREKGVESDTRGLLTSLSYPGPLILFALLLALLTSGLQVRRVHAAITYNIASPMACGPAVGRELMFLRIVSYVQDIAGIIIIATILRLRVTIAHSIDQFNNDNSTRQLGHEAFHEKRLSVPMVMRADVGTAFGCLTIAGVLLLIVSRVEHRRLHQEGKHVHPHADAVHSSTGKEHVNRSMLDRESWASIVSTPLSAMVKPTHRSISYPLPIVKPH
ncbi:hypothetical protein MCUN1_003618 [Malassezia cuniculi]|uniref:Uncharacterized protein n=1 Tax=Malassezia cuniculi TaxID=948313 RepID=A0AAF0EYS3_9BASI|nr:hypothetical protein MCUN1_003618 [Malassezia cuniculi]